MGFSCYRALQVQIGEMDGCARGLLRPDRLKDKGNFELGAGVDGRRVRC